MQCKDIDGDVIIASTYIQNLCSAESQELLYISATLHLILA